MHGGFTRESMQTTFTQAQYKEIDHSLERKVYYILHNIFMWFYTTKNICNLLEKIKPYLLLIPFATCKLGKLGG